MKMEKSIKRKNRNSDIKGINITPFVDVMLVLLIVFMLGSPMINFAIPVDAPKMKSNTLNKFKADDITIMINLKGEIYLDNKLESIKSLKKKLRTSNFGNKDSRIFIMADENLIYKRISEVIDVVNLSGFKRVSLVFNKK